MPRRGGADPDDDDADLDAPEHAWWASGSTDPYEYRTEPGPDAEAGADPHVGADPDPEPGPAPAAAPDPYAVLRVAPDASWDEIVAAHRKLVRWWHPDGLGPEAGEEERELSATRMRELSAAYRELKVRRGR